MTMASHLIGPVGIIPAEKASMRQAGGIAMRAFVLGLTLLVGLVTAKLAAPVPPKKGDAAGTSPAYKVDPRAGLVVAQSADGKARWSTRLEGHLDGVRDPHIVWDDKRVYVTHKDGVTALDANTGKVLWHTTGPSDRLLLSRDLLLATDCTSASYVPESGRLLTARTLTTGAEAFRVNLPVEDFDPLPIEEMAGLFLVQTVESPGGKGNALFIDRQGKVRHRLRRQVVAGLRRGADIVLLTSTDVVGLTPNGTVRWAVPFRSHEWIAGGGLVELPDGDVVAFRYGCISDSGVDVVRIEPSGGKAVWQAYCDRLGVGHSKYFHEANVVVKGGKVQVTSRASGGTFIEELDLRSGKRLSRARPAGE
jgi:outer membrane protein assembly factor BamB